MKCMDCGKEFEVGYICEERQKFLCIKCHDKCDGWRFDNHTHKREPEFKH